ncbi:MAG: tRNA-dihydrouridine synthase family protein [Clostridia bacterium]|nr:tRNA-dihydrouridine synthase family protein [Clostridia bacterium]
MNLYFAPMEGLTDAIYRRVHHDTFGGVTQYYMPFISPTASQSYTAREMFDLSPRENAGVPVVPQVLARDAAYFLGAARMLCDAGYTEINLNVGCPSGTVTAKGKGAGLLKEPDQLRRFLDAAVPRCPLPLTVKTRLGYNDPAEWPQLLSIYMDYPLKALILHPRTSREFYAGQPHNEVFDALLSAAPFPVIHNGNVFTPADGRRVMAEHPALAGLMLGRGLATNPALARQLQDGEGLTKESLLLFHDRLYREYMRHWTEHAAIGRMHGIMGYLRFCFSGAARPLRALRKSTTPREYADAVAWLFDEGELIDPPVFIPPN